MNEQLTQSSVQPQRFVVNKEFTDPTNPKNKCKPGDDVSHIRYAELLELKDAGLVTDLMNQ